MGWVLGVALRAVQHGLGLAFVGFRLEQVLDAGVAEGVAAVDQDARQVES